MNITISNVKKLANGHEGERVCSAVVLIDGVPFATAADSPYGALMQFETISLPESDFIKKLQEIESELGKEIINHPQGFSVHNSLHLVVSNLINDEFVSQGLEKEYQRNMKRLGYVFNDNIYLFPAKIKPTEEAIRGMRDRADWVPENRVLQEIPKEEFIALLRKQSGL